MKQFWFISLALSSPGSHHSDHSLSINIHIKGKGKDTYIAIVIVIRSQQVLLAYSIIVILIS